MKEIKLESGRGIRILNQYKNNVVVARNAKGFYIIEDKKQYGPYVKVYLDVSQKHNNDRFLLGFNFDESEIYRIGINGLEFTERVDTSKDLSKLLLKKIDISNHENFSKCLYIGKTETWFLFADKDDKLFIVNGLDDVMPEDSYPKFDNYEELVLAYREKGYKLFSSDLYSATNFKEYVRLDSIPESIFKLTWYDLGDKMQKRMLDLIPIDAVSDLEAELILKRIRKYLDTKSIPKFRLNDEKKQELEDDGYVEFNFKQFLNFRHKYRDTFNKVLSNFQQVYESLQREGITNCPDYIKNLFDAGKPRYHSRETFEQNYLPILTNEYNEDIFTRILMFIGLQDYKIKQFSKVVPKVYNQAYQFCEENFFNIRKMIVERRLKDLAEVLNDSIENLKNCKGKRKYQINKQIAECESEMGDLRVLLNKINFEMNGEENPGTTIKPW